VLIILISVIGVQLAEYHKFMKTLKKYLNSRIDTITSVLALPRSAYTTESWHLLRVEIKKLNALFDLIGYCVKDFKRKKLFQPFKQVFRQTGKARELQVEIALLEKNFADDRPPNDFIAGLNKLRSKEEKAFFSMLNIKLIGRMKKRSDKISDVLSDIKKKQVKRYLAHQSNRIRTIIQAGDLLPEALHELRKQIKILDYNKKSLPLELPDSMTNKTALPDLLGEWHDLEVMAGHLKKELDAGGMSPEEIIQLEAVHTQLTTGTKDLLEQISTALPASEFSETPPR
jgi:CHAD domain-containing protein